MWVVFMPDGGGGGGPGDVPPHHTGPSHISNCIHKTFQINQRLVTTEVEH